MGMLVTIHMLVNPFGAHANFLLRAQPPTDLLRTPLFAEQPVNAVPRGTSNAPSDFGALPVQRELVGLVRTMASQALNPPHFTADDGLMDTKDASNLGQRGPAFNNTEI